MFGPLGMWEVIFILVLALLIFGPKRLPQIGRTLGRGIAEFRRASTDLKRTFNAELSLDDEEEAAEHPRRAPAMRPRPGAEPAPSIAAARPPEADPGSGAAEEVAVQEGAVPRGGAPAEPPPEGAAPTEEDSPASR